MLYFCILRATMNPYFAISISSLEMQSQHGAPPTIFGSGLAIAFSKSESDPEEMGTPGEVGYDSHHGSADIRNLSTH